MSNEERDIILQMVSENKISTAEAADLLDALKESEAEERDSSAGDWVGNLASEAVSQAQSGMRKQLKDAHRFDRDARRYERDMERQARHAEREARRGRTGRSLLIHVSDGGETRTHVHIPIGMALAAGKFIPKKARVYFEEYGIDLTDLLDSVANDLGQTGELINIQDGETRVLVSIAASDWAPTPAAPPAAPAAPTPPNAPAAPSEPAPHAPAEGA